jgi:glutathione S-transferase
MKLYYFEGACSLADHIALLEAGFTFDLERVDPGSKLTSRGADFSSVNSKGYVPALELGSGEVITENIAILDWIAAQAPSVGLQGALGRTRLLEALAYIATEIHKGFQPFFKSGSDEERASSLAHLLVRLRWIAERMQGPYLFGDRPTVADFYLFVMLRWATKMGISLPGALAAMRDRLYARPAVKIALATEEPSAIHLGAA